MNRPGHVGVTMLALSPFIPKLGVEFVAMAALFSMLPDIDIILRIRHREYTHNFTFATLATLLFFFMFRYAHLPEILSLAVFVSITIHILVDSLTMQKFPPFFPFSKKRIAFRVFRSNKGLVNGSAFILGALCFVYFAGGGNVWW